jgi:hypothetical protein
MRQLTCVAPMLMRVKPFLLQTMHDVAVDMHTGKSADRLMSQLDSLSQNHPPPKKGPTLPPRAGKSSLLSAILGELDLITGHALLPVHGIVQQQQQQAVSAAVRVRRIGYVSQSPWLMRGSVRDNVLLGQPYDAELIREVRPWEGERGRRHRRGVDVGRGGGQTDRGGGG